MGETSDRSINPLGEKPLIEASILKDIILGVAALVPRAHSIESSSEHLARELFGRL